MSNVATSHPADDDEIDLRDLFLTLISKRKLIAVCGSISMAFAAFYAYGIASPVFESSALLTPIQTPTSDQFGAAAALLGGKKSSGSADVDLYQSLLTSRTVMHKLLLTPIKNLSDTGKGQEEQFFKILMLDTSKQTKVEDCIAGLSKSVIVGTSENGGILEVKFSAGTPWLAKEIGDTLLKISQEELRQVRIERFDVILARLAIAVNQARLECDSAAKALAFYKDRNRSVTLPEQILAVSRLEMEKSSKEQKYLLARKEYEIQQLERAKATPPMMILDPANLPSRKSKPKRMMIVALGLLFGLVTSSFGVLAWSAISNHERKPPC